MISETKINESFPNGNFIIEGFSTPYRLDRDSKGGGGGGVFYMYEKIYPLT